MNPLPSIMCLTQDGESPSHAQQARELARAGARIIQLRTKTLRGEALQEEANAFVRECHTQGALAIINDHVEVAVAADADGVHLGKADMPWEQARELLGPGKLIGGTVNDAVDARRASCAGCIDYVGVGPLRFTETKKLLAPVLGLEGIRALLPELAGIPAYVIGGVLHEDLSSIKALGVQGVAVCAPLFARGRIEDNFRRYQRHWEI